MSLLKEYKKKNFGGCAHVLKTNGSLEINIAAWCGLEEGLKSQVVLLQTAHSWANAGVLLGARMHRERVAFETIKVSGWS